MQCWSIRIKHKRFQIDRQDSYFSRNEIDVDLIHNSQEASNQDIVQEYHKGKNEPEFPSEIETDSDVDIDEVHQVANAEDERLKQKFWEYHKSMATTAMVEECTRQHRLRLTAERDMTRQMAKPTPQPQTPLEPSSNGDTTNNLPEKWLKPP